MSRKALEIKAQREPKFKVRKYNRCPLCGRPRAFIRKFNMCRCCFRAVSYTHLREKGFLQAGHETSYISRNESRCSGR